jgi:MFS superfamily sulfate permease-like transporter
MVALVVRANRHPLLMLGRKPGTNVFRPLSPEHPEDETVPGLLLLRPAGGIYFGNAPRLGQEIRALVQRHQPKVLVLDFSAVPNLEYTALKMLSEGEENLRRDGTVLWLTALNPDVLAVVQRSDLWGRLGRERLYFTLEQAVARFQQETAGAPGQAIEKERSDGQREKG